MSLMKPALPQKHGLKFIIMAALISLATVACSPSTRPNSLSETQIRQQETPTPTDVWLALLKKGPHPYTTPLPPETPTVLDGLYAKVEPKEGTPVPCRRCPDYLPEGGLWKLNLDKGVFRILHEPTDWRSLGSFTVLEDRLVLFNDPTCFNIVGVYKWKLEAGELNLEVVEDTCHVDRRARSFTNYTWTSCQPPNIEAGVTNHWSKPPGCE
jgi:hypothetical protein